MSDKILDLRNCDFTGKNLSGKVLSGALLKDATLSKSILRETVLTKVTAFLTRLLHFYMPSSSSMPVLAMTARCNVVTKDGACAAPVRCMHAYVFTNPVTFL